MRELLHGAVADAREFVGEVVGDLRQEAALTDDEVLARYEGQRGDPWAVLSFVQGSTGLQGQAAVDEALRYEREMEGLWAGRTGRRFSQMDADGL